MMKLSSPILKPILVTSPSVRPRSIIVLNDSINDTALNGRLGSCAGDFTAQRPIAWKIGPASYPQVVSS